MQRLYLYLGHVPFTFTLNAPLYNYRILLQVNSNNRTDVLSLCSYF